MRGKGWVIIGGMVAMMLILALLAPDDDDASPTPKPHVTKFHAISNTNSIKRGTARPSPTDDTAEEPTTPGHQRHVHVCVGHRIRMCS